MPSQIRRPNCVPPSHTRPTLGADSMIQLSNHHTPQVHSTRDVSVAPHYVELLRKEVIQPHLPVRLPCYDFVPIASPTFDDSLPKGWAAGFGCYQLS